jgi:hypothetical protein
MTHVDFLVSVSRARDYVAAGEPVPVEDAAQLLAQYDRLREMLAQQRAARVPSLEADERAARAASDASAEITDPSRLVPAVIRDSFSREYWLAIVKAVRRSYDDGRI